MAKPKLNLKQRGFEEILTLANNIKTAMTGNATFANPTPTPVAFGALITTAQTKLSEFTAAQQTAQTKTSERNDAFEALEAAAVSKKSKNSSRALKPTGKASGR